MVALPIALVLLSLSLVHYWRERELLEYQIGLTASQLGDMMVGNLRHAMMVNDREMLEQILTDVGRMENVHKVQILDLEGRVKVDSRDEGMGESRQRDDLGCTKCHQSPAESWPRVAELPTSAGVVRISVPIENEPGCTGCHTEDTPILGELLFDVSLIDVEEHLLRDLQVDLVVSAGSTILVTLGLYLLMHSLVVQRVEAFRRPLAEFAAGDFTPHLPTPLVPADELDELASTFNQMAQELDRRGREQEELSELRQRAIVEERERIARELHDGLAQLLGYVNTKTMAVRLMLKNQQVEDADRHLLQLDEATRELSVDVRQAVLGLRTAGQIGDGLTVMLGDFAAQFSRFGGVPVEVAVAPEIQTLALTAEAELQLLRIVQEALTNVRKHASATQAWVSLEVNDNILELTIGDNDNGFDVEDHRLNDQSHFGLSTMRERAEAIGAEFNLDSEPGAGTRVTVRLAEREG